MNTGLDRGHCTKSRVTVQYLDWRSFQDDLQVAGQGRAGQGRAGQGVGRTPSGKERTGKKLAVLHKSNMECDLVDYALIMQLGGRRSPRAQRPTTAVALSGHNPPNLVQYYLNNIPRLVNETASEVQSLMPHDLSQRCSYSQTGLSCCCRTRLSTWGDKNDITTQYLGRQE